MTPSDRWYPPCTGVAPQEDGSCACVQCRKYRPRNVDRRELVIPKGVRSGLHRLDRTLVGTADGDTGPLVQRLLDLGNVPGLAWGAYGGAGAGVHKLVRTLAEHGADRKWQEMGCLSAHHCKGILTWQMQRRFCFANWRGMDRNLQIRLGLLTGSSSIHTAQACRGEYRAKEAACGPRGGCAPTQSVHYAWSGHDCGREAQGV